MRALASLVGLLVAVLPSNAYSAADPIPPHPPSPLAGLPTDVFHGQVVTLADGDRYEVTLARQGQSIRGRRWDAGTQTWGSRRVIFTDPGVCWDADIDARASGTAVVVTAECDEAFALVSTDTEHWDSSKLADGSWSAPAISPSGTHAAWSRADDYLTWDSAGGFVSHTAAPPADSDGYGEPVITDDGTVTIAYVDAACSVTIDTYTAPGVPTRQVLPTPDGCIAGVVPIDAHTVLVGETEGDWSASRLTRSDDTSPWVVSAVAPLLAPGLLRDVYEPSGPGPSLLDVPELPLAMVGNSTADELGVQVFDPATQAWRPPTTLVTRPDGTKCSLRQDDSPQLRFYALHLTCAGPNRFVTSADGGSWRALPIAAKAAGTYLERGLVAVPDRHRTVVVARETPTVTLPVGSVGRCDAVQPVATDRLLRLTASPGSHGWPNVLQRSTTKGWHTLRRVPMPTRGSCRQVFTRDGWAPGFQLRGGDQSVQVRFVKVGGRWEVRVR